MMKVKIMMTIEVDPQDYAVPSDGMLEEEIQDYLKDIIHEIDGLQIKNIRTVMENKHD
jgi:hypothetical protein